jgi:hypothetical protein
MDGGNLTIEQKGPNGWSVIGSGALLGAALVIIALALMQLATWAGIGLIIMAAGQAAFNFCRGAALLIEAHARAQAIVTEANTRRMAVMREKPLLPPPEGWR